MRLLEKLTARRDEAHASYMKYQELLDLVENDFAKPNATKALGVMNGAKAHHANGNGNGATVMKRGPYKKHKKGAKRSLAGKNTVNLAAVTLPPGVKTPTIDAAHVPMGDAVLLAVKAFNGKKTTTYEIAKVLDLTGYQLGPSPARKVGVQLANHARYGRIRPQGAGPNKAWVLTKKGVSASA